MDLLYQFVELFASFTEAAIVISVASSMAQKRYTGKKHFLLVFIFTVIFTVVVTLLNKWHAFSFVTIGVGVVGTILILSVLSTGNLLLRTTSAILAWMFMFAVDYVLVYGLFMIIGNSVNISHGFSLIMTQGSLRTAFLITDKMIQVIIFTLCRKLYPKILLLNKKNMRFLFVIAFLSFIVIHILTAITLMDSILSVQIAVIFTVFFLVLSLITTIFAITISAKHQNERRTVELMRLSSQMMEKNYNEMHSSQELIRQQVHDFKNHLRTIDGMLENTSKVKDYTQNLLETSYSYARMCNCGNEIIDSIINCKKAEAKEKNIHFEYNICLSAPLNIKSIDICAILANQIDNAIEACMKIDNEDRKITVHISQKEAFVFFKVINTTATNPFDKNRDLLTTKNNNDGLHGFGIRIIRETAEKYNGAAENSYKDGKFSSAVMLSNNI